MQDQNIRSLRPVRRDVAVLRSLVAALALLAFAGGQNTVAAAPVSGILVFGDSLADIGNAAIATGGAVPQSPPYAPGRFSNGPIWVDHLASHYGFNLLPSFAGGTDYAVGGATSGSNLPQDIPGTLSIAGQAQSYLTAHGGVADPNALYVVMGGANDLFAAVQTPAQTLAIINAGVSNLVGTAAGLIGSGAQHILVSGIPDVGLTPFVLGLDAASGAAGQIVAGATLLSSTFNSALVEALQQLSQSVPSARIDLLDLFDLSETVADNPGPFGLTDVVDACFDGVDVCANPDQYYFWDDVHPTAAGHQIIADAAIRAVSEPSSVLTFAGALLMLGLGATAVRRRRVVLRVES